MFDWLKLTILRQILALTLCALLALGIGWYFEFHPLLKPEIDYLVRGIVAGTIAALVVVFFHLLFLLAFPRRHASALRVVLDEQRAQTSVSWLGRCVVATCGEEMLLRAYVLGLLSYKIGGWAIAVNALLTFIVYFRGPRLTTYSLVRMLEGMFFAALYLQHRSLMLVGVAHATSEGILLILACSQKLAGFLNKDTFHARDIYGLIISTRSRIPG